MTNKAFHITNGGVWTYEFDNDQTLAEGEIQTETFTMTVTDDKGAANNQDIIITITGTK